MAQKHWARWLPARYAQIEDPDSFFSDLGRLTAERIDSLALDLAGEMTTAPAFSDKELDLVRQEQLAGFEQQLQNPTAIAFNTLQNTISKWPKADPRHPDSVADHVEERGTGGGVVT